MPYASLQPNGSSFLEYKQSLVSWAVKAQQLGFAAAKCECTLTGPYNHSGTHLRSIATFFYPTYYDAC